MEKYQKYIISRDGEFLVSVPYSDTLVVRWSNSKFDAYRFWRYSTARKVADKVGGRVNVLNVITGVIS